MRAVPALDLVRPMNARCIALPRPSGLFLASTYSSSDGVQDRQGWGYFFDISAKLRGEKRLTSTGTLIQRTATQAHHEQMFYIGLDVDRKTVSAASVRAAKPGISLLG
jgi:hypothetical protein